MSVRSYWSVCGIFMLASALLFAAGYTTMMTLVVLGFIAFGLTFMGMMCVLPLTVAHPSEPKRIEEQTPARVVTAEAAPA